MINDADTDVGIRAVIILGNFNHNPKFGPSSLTLSRFLVGMN